MECPNCRTQNRPEAKFCQVCGAILNHNPHANPETNAVQAVNQPNLPITAPLSTRNDTYQPLPVGALLDRGRYVIWELRETGETLNTYLVEDIVPVRQCTNCNNLVNTASAQVCADCGASLSTAQAVTLRYIAEERLLEQTTDIERHLMESNLQHPGLNLPHAIFTEKPYGQERHYRLLPEFPPQIANTLSEPQELTTVLSWGIILAEALDILHNEYISPHLASLDDIVIENNQIAWTNLYRAVAISQKESSDAKKIQHNDVRNLSGILWYLATKQTKVKPVKRIPDAVYTIFFQANKGEMEAKTFALELSFLFDELHRPDCTTLVVGQRTDVGRLRSLNEDSLLTLDYAAVYRSLSVPIGVYVVADGMGGHAAGDVASRLTCQVLAKRITHDLVVPAAEGELPSNTVNWLTDAVKEANQAVYNSRYTTHSDMGNTLVAAVVISNIAIIANVGDSRCYHLTPDGISQITTDHSFVERLVETGQITREEAAVHPQKNVIYRVIGDKEDVDVDIFKVNLNQDEALLLCSDGLNGMINDSKIFELWTSSQSPQQACDTLVEAANQAGGEDNITVVIVQILP